MLRAFSLIIHPLALHHVVRPQETMEKKVTGKGTLKGKLDVYRYIDNIWTFVVSKATLRSASHQAVPKKDEDEEEVEGTVKLTVVDAKLLKLMKGK